MNHAEQDHHQIPRTHSLCPALLLSGASQVAKSVTAQESQRRVRTRECSAPEFIGRRPHLFHQKEGGGGEEGQYSVNRNAWNWVEGGGCFWLSLTTPKAVTKNTPASRDQRGLGYKHAPSINSMQILVTGGGTTPVLHPWTAPSRLIAPGLAHTWLGFIMQRQPLQKSLYCQLWLLPMPLHTSHTARTQRPFFSISGIWTIDESRSF